MVIDMMRGDGEEEWVANGEEHGEELGEEYGDGDGGEVEEVRDGWRKNGGTRCTFL